MTAILGQILNSGLPQYVMANIMGKASPKLKQFISGAMAAGYPLEKIIDYFQETSEGPGTTQRRHQLQQRQSQGQASDYELNLLQSLQNKGAPRGLLKALGPLLGGAAGLALGGGQAEQEQLQQNVGRRKSPPGSPLSLEALTKQRMRSEAGPQVDINNEFPKAVRFIQNQLAQGKDPKSIMTLMRQLGQKDPFFKRALREMPQAARMPMEKLIESMLSVPEQEMEQPQPAAAGAGAESLLNPEESALFKEMMDIISQMGG